MINIFLYIPTYGSSSWDENRLIQNLNDTGLDTGVTVGMCVKVRHQHLYDQVAILLLKHK